MAEIGHIFHAGYPSEEIRNCIRFWLAGLTQEERSLESARKRENELVNGEKFPSGKFKSYLEREMSANSRQKPVAKQVSTQEKNKVYFSIANSDWIAEKIFGRA